MKKSVSFKTLLLAVILSIAVAIPALAQREEIDLPDKEFTMVEEVWRTPAKSQGRTGTCWCFSTTSFLETEVDRLGNGKWNLSEIFTVYHAYLEKAAHFVRLHGNMTFGQGGLSHDVLYLVQKYGLVRREDYNGLFLGEENHNHRDLSRSAKAFVNEVIKARPGELNWKWMEAYKGILNGYIGPVPKEIQVGDKKLTPVQFANDVLKIPYDDYVEITSYSSIPFYKKGQLLIPDNWMRAEMYNVPIDDFIKVMDHALNNKISLVIDLDVASPTYSREKGYAIAPKGMEEMEVDQKLRDELFDTWATIDHHLQHMVGIAKDKDGKKFYLIKDSGGPNRGPFKGHFYFSENFIRTKILFIMVHKDGIPADIKAKLGI